uniref:Transposase, C-terminal part n=1 Tax=Escherichia coli TaxID=562 RepID=Q3ZTZ6_ECOLX|nr:transposase, C-terminal part [Escherichia coli]
MRRCVVSARLPYLQEKQTVTDLAGVGRAANNALHIIAIGRLRTDDKTKEYVAKQVAEGHTKMEAIRCLKRYISRVVYTLLRNQNRHVNSIPITS